MVLGLAYFLKCIFLYGGRRKFSKIPHVVRNLGCVFLFLDGYYSGAGFSYPVFSYYASWVYLLVPSIFTIWNTSFFIHLVFHTSSFFIRLLYSYVLFCSYVLLFSYVFFFSYVLLCFIRLCFHTSLFPRTSYVHVTMPRMA